MAWEDWVGAVFGVIFIAVGLAYLFSPRFAQWAFAYAAQGIMWRKLLGETWAPIVAKFFFSLVSIALGVWVIYSSVAGR
jgi:hypothetical protein